jgi:SAM-dependent methyltransferase
VAWLDRLRSVVLRRPTGVVVWNTLANQRNRLRLRPGAAVHLRGGDEAPSAEAAAGYALHKWAEFTRWLPGRGADLSGARVLELGPGEDRGVLWCALAHGAALAQGADKFAPVRDDRREAALLAALRARLGPAPAARLDAALAAGDRLRECFDCPAERLGERFPAGSFDLVLSRSVLEYVHGLEAALRGLRDLLAPGGWMVHKIDARDDGLFSQHGHHPLTFLTVAHATYRAMTSHTYRPHRGRLDDYRRLLQRLGWRAEFRICRVLGQPGELPEPVEALIPGRDYGSEERRLLREIRPRLHSHFAAQAEADLLATGFYLFAQR